MSGQVEALKERISTALDMASEHGGFPGEHHKSWLIDQMVRVLTGCVAREEERTDKYGNKYWVEILENSDDYNEFVRDFCSGDNGPNTYEWNTGTAP